MSAPHVSLDKVLDRAATTRGYNAPLAFLTLGTEGYGVRRIWLGLADVFTKLEVHFTVTSIMPGSLARDFGDRGVAVAMSPVGLVPQLTGRGLAKFGRAPTLLLAQSRLVRWLVGQLRKSDARAIVVRNPSEVILAGLAGRIVGVDTFWIMPNYVTDYPFDLNRRVYRFAFRYLRVVPIANSHFTASTLGPGDFRRHVMHLGVDPEEFSPTAEGGERAELGLSTTAIVLGVFARMVPEKGQMELVEALAALGEVGADVHLLCCGGPLDTPYVDRLRRTIEGHGLTGRVHLVGPVSQPRSYYRICDVVVNSRIDPEPFGLSVIEAMMMGKPVLVHKAGGPGETVIDGVTGWHVHEPTVQGFVEGMREMLAGRQDWPQIGAAARRHALASFTVDAMAERFLAIVAQHTPPSIT